MEQVSHQWGRRSIPGSPGCHRTAQRLGRLARRRRFEDGSDGRHAARSRGDDLLGVRWIDSTQPNDRQCRLRYGLGKSRHSQHFDQSDIEQLLTSAEETGFAPASGTGQPHAPVQVDPKDLARLLHMRVQLEVVLAERPLEFDHILKLAPGSIIEFDRASDAELTLAVGNRKIGGGQAVKVGEYFGLHINWLGTLDERIRALGR